MIHILCTSVLLLAIIGGWGNIGFKFLGFRNKSLSQLLISGLISVTIIQSLIAFFYPLNLNIEIPIVIIGILLFFWNKTYEIAYNFFKKKAFSVLFIAISALAGSSYPFILDHFGYYEPSILWLKNYGLVKGIANLDLLLGQMSLWHIFQTGFSNFTDIYLRINVFLLIIYIIYAIENKKYILLIFLPLFLLFIQSPSPDLPVISFSLIILNEITSETEKKDWLLPLAIYIFAIKPTMLWPILLIFGLYDRKILEWKSLCISSIILIIFFLKNLWCFGYPIFPVQLFDLGLSWKPNADVMKISSKYAIMKTYDMQYSYKQIVGFSNSEAILKWFTLKGMKSKINVLLIVFLVVFGVFASLKKKKIYHLIFFSLLIKSIIILLFSAQYRFFIDIFFAIIFIFLYKLENRIFLRLSLILSLSALSILFYPNFLQKLVPSFRVGQFIRSVKKRQVLFPMEYKQTEFSPKKIDNLQFNIPKKHSFCYKTPLPAISPEFIIEYYEAGIFPQKIGNDLKNGFIWKILNPKEKLKLRKLIETQIENTQFQSVENKKNRPR